MIIHLAGLETWHQQFLECRVRNVLGSYFYMRRMRPRRFSALIDGLRAEQERRRKANEPPMRVMLDSGAFTFGDDQAASRPPTPTYAKDYIQFVRDTADVWTAVVELDVDDPQFNNATSAQCRDWLDELAEAHPCAVPVWHPYRGMDRWMEYVQDPRWTLLGIGSDRAHGVPAMLDRAHRFGKAVHGFAETKLLTESKYLNYDSVDSTTWVNATKYGAFYVFMGNRLRRLDHKHKFDRRLYKAHLESRGLDIEKVMKEDQAELTKASLIAWRDLAARYEARRHYDEWTRRNDVTGPRDRVAQEAVGGDGAAGEPGDRRERGERSGRGDGNAAGARARRAGGSAAGRGAQVRHGGEAGLAGDGEHGNADVAVARAPQGEGVQDRGADLAGAGAGGGRARAVAGDGIADDAERAAARDGRGGLVAAGGRAAEHVQGGHVTGRRSVRIRLVDGVPVAVRPPAERGHDRATNAADTARLYGHPMPVPGRPETYVGPDGAPRCAPARNTGHKWQAHEEEAIAEIGARLGCWTCGTRDIGGETWIKDHWPRTMDLPACLFGHDEPEGWLACQRTRGEAQGDAPIYGEPCPRHDEARQVLLAQCPDCSHGQGGGNNRGSVHAPKARTDERSIDALTTSAPGSREGRAKLKAEADAYREARAIATMPPHMLADGGIAGEGAQGDHAGGDAVPTLQGGEEHAVPDGPTPPSPGAGVPDAITRSVPGGPATASIRRLPVLQAASVPHPLESLPKVVCSGCAMSEFCPLYEEGSACGYDVSIEAVGTRDVGALMDLKDQLLKIDIDRTLRAVMLERRQAQGQLDTKVSGQLDRLHRLMDEHRMMIRGAEPPRPQFSASVTVSTQGHPPNGNPGSLLRDIFGGMAARRSEVQESEPSRARVIDVDAGTGVAEEV